MAKPLGYYCNGDLFDDLVEQYGSQLQDITRQQKLFLITSIAGDLCAQMQGEQEDSLKEPHLTDTAARINKELTADEKESLLVALIHQIRERHEAPKVKAILETID